MEEYLPRIREALGPSLCVNQVAGHDSGSGGRGIRESRSPSVKQHAQSQPLTRESSFSDNNDNNYLGFRNTKNPFLDVQTFGLRVATIS